jgi:hypothetical protein
LIFEALNSLFDFGQSARAGALNSFLIFEALNSFFDFVRTCKVQVQGLCRCGGHEGWLVIVRSVRAELANSVTNSSD